MKQGKVAIAVGGMLVMGALALWGFAALVEYRLGQPIANDQAAPASTYSPLETLRAGVGQNLQFAADALRQGNDTGAARALDGGKRLTEVGAEAAPGAEFSRVHEMVKTARKALQNGNRQRAVQVLAEASSILETHARAADQEQDRTRVRQPQSRRESTPPDRYRGATVLNAHGARIGEVERIDGGRAMLVIGAHRDVLGMIDFNDGERIEIPDEQLIFGKSKSVGSTMVVLPVFSSAPKEIVSEVRAH